MSKLPSLQDVDLDSVVDRVSSKQEEWASLSVQAKIKLLEALIETAKQNDQYAHDQSALSRGINLNNKDDQQMSAHVWATTLLPWASWLTDILIFFTGIQKNKGVLPKPSKVSKRPSGQLCCKIGPVDTISWLFLGTPTYEVILEESQTSPTQSQGPLTKPAGTVGILGAGNYDAAIDVLTALFIQNKVAVYKANPFGFPYISNLLKVLCQPLIEAGYLAVIDGGGDVGEALLKHPKVSEWYMTGSKHTFNSIMWGNPEGPQSETQAPKFDKPVVAELGGCSPVIIAPSKWSSMEMKLQIGNLAVFTMFNGGHICVRPQCIVTCKNWPQREEFVAGLKKKLEGIAPWRSFYPGSFNRTKHFADMLTAEGYDPNEFLLNETASFKAYGNGTLSDNNGINIAERCPTGCGKNEKRHPMVFAANVSPYSKTLKEEAFCPVLLEVCLDTPAEYDEFLAAASRFSNDTLVGNLTATIVAKDYKHPAVAKAVDHLKHGIVGVNVNGVNAIVQPGLFWGGGRASTIRDVQSGVGLFGNLYCLDKPVKALVTAPFFNMALMAQQVKDNGASQPTKLFSRLARTFLARRYWINPFKFIFWTIATSLALFNL
eukprot:GDKJ01058566.1.p1 GENE.GDKJ01058566.1~~GDKJ01058566.1.p1  ORF type:complete len:602 (+),score=136.98 GDKJ01058566.1:8-1813(+)